LSDIRGAILNRESQSADRNLGAHGRSIPNGGASNAIQRAGKMPQKPPLIIASVLLSMIGWVPASAQESYSYEEQEACTVDAFRLCSDKIPDIPRITACMQAKRDQLSPRCAKMFAPGRERRLEPGQTPYHDPLQQPLEDHHDKNMQ